MDVLDWIEKAKNYDSDTFLNEFALDIIEDPKAVDVQLQQWGKEGTDITGEVIGYYKKSTEDLSGGLKREGDFYNLQNTGDFWEKTFLNAVIKGKDLEFTFDSSGINKNKLFETIKKYGEIDNPDYIFGLDASYHIPFITIIEPKFIKQLENYYNV